MGLRSWLTPVYSELDFRKVIKFAENYNDGVSYVIQITKVGKHPWKLGDVIVAWFGDGSSSIYGLKPNISYYETWGLDAYLDEFPDWHLGKGPSKYGNEIYSEQTPDWSLVIKPKVYMKFDYSFQDLVFAVYYKSTYNCISSWFDSNDYFNFIFMDGSGILYKVEKINCISKFPLIYRLNANIPDIISPPTIYKLDNTAERIFITDKLEIKSLLKYLKSKPKKSFIDII